MFIFSMIFHRKIGFSSCFGLAASEQKHLISSGAQAKGIKRWDATIHLLRIVWGYFMGLYGI
jgi:hypothetical protein